MLTVYLALKLGREGPRRCSTPRTTMARFYPVLFVTGAEGGRFRSIEQPEVFSVLLKAYTQASASLPGGSTTRYPTSVKAVWHTIWHQNRGYWTVAHVLRIDDDALALVGVFIVHESDQVTVVFSCRSDPRGKNRLTAVTP